MAPLPSLHDAPHVHWQIWLADARGLGFAQAAKGRGTIPGQRQPGGTAPGGRAVGTMAGLSPESAAAAVYWHAAAAAASKARWVRARVCRSASVWRPGQCQWACGVRHRDCEKRSGARAGCIAAADEPH